MPTEHESVEHESLASQMFDVPLLQLSEPQLSLLLQVFGKLGPVQELIDVQVLAVQVFE